MRSRLALTVALVYALHFAPNVVRETYLAVALGDSCSIRVDRFVGLHPDIFVIPGRGAFIDSNPGASMLAAIPYAAARPVLALLYFFKPSLVAAKPPAAYDDPRPNRTRFMNEMRARGLDVRLALAAAAIHLGLDVPLGALSAVLVFLFLRDRIGRERTALWLALLFAFGTPAFFRSAFLNQNLVLADCTLFAFLALTWTQGGGTRTPWSEASRLLLAGLFLGIGLLCDYSAAPLLLVFGAWGFALGLRDGGPVRALRSAGVFTLGAAAPIVLLLCYQYAAFGNPLLPAQAYMPATDLSVHGWHGVRLPSLDLLWRNLLDPAYGLFVFCPMLAAAVLAPACEGPGAMRRQELALIFGASFALYLFSSSVAFAALQWNTGVRYLVPAVPLLFFALVPVLLRASGWIRALLVVPSATIAWCVSMARESVPVSLAEIATRGPELPWHTVLRKTASAYPSTLSSGALPLTLFALVALVLWMLWSARWPARAA